MKKYITIGIVIELTIKRDIRNKTYLSDEEFIKDKDIILNIIKKNIDIDLFNISIDTNSIKLTIKEEILKNNLEKLKDFISMHSLYEFSPINFRENNNTFCNSIIDEYYFNDIDKDFNSMYYPVFFDTKVIELFISSNKVNITDINNILTLLKSYSNEFFDNVLRKLLIYSIEN